MDRAIFDYIKTRYDCITYAQTTLGLTPRATGHGQYRCRSFRSDARNSTSLLLTRDSWHDFGSGKGGDVISLCAEAHYGGNIGEALRELAPEKCRGFKADEWETASDRLQRTIEYWHNSLRSEDIEYLHKRRISDETISRLKIGYAALMDRIIVPYYRNGRCVYWAGRTMRPVVKGDNPKYMKGKLDKNPAYENCPWGVHTFSRNFRVNEKYANIAIVSEGMFDILSCEQEGFRSLSPIGGFFSKYQLPEVFSLCRGLDYVFICNDSDGSGLKFNLNMCKELFKQDIQFRVGTLPAGIKDISDYYAGGGEISALVDSGTDGLVYLASHITAKDEFAELVHEAARKVGVSVLVDMGLQAAQFDAKYVESLVSEAKKMPPEKDVIQELTKRRNILYSDGSGFFEYSGGVWNMRGDNSIKSYLSEILGRFATGSRLSSICSHMKAKLNTTVEFNTQHVFNFRNGMLDLDDGKLYPHSAEYMSTVQVPYEYDPSNQPDAFLTYIYDVFDADTEKIRLAQEMGGYVLFPDNRLQVAFFLMGEGSNGKSVMIDTIKAVYGERNCSNVNISRFGNEFEPIRLRYSLVNVCAETKTNLKDAESSFKAIVSGDTISAAFKGKDAVEFRPRCKIIMAANNYVASNDISYGFLRRILFLKFAKRYTRETADRNLTARIRQELPGVFNWFYKGYMRLKEQGDFTRTFEQESMMQEFMSELNPVASFIEEECMSSFRGIHSMKSIYSQYTLWAKGSGFSVMNRIHFSRTFCRLVKQMIEGCEVSRSSGYTTVNFG